MVLFLAAVEDNNDEWDDDWDGQAVNTCSGNNWVDDEGRPSGHSAHGPSVKISLNK